MAERIRDKVTASKRKGLWVGGVVPLGYPLVERKLLINDQEQTDLLPLSRAGQRQ